jgi:Fic family protein
MFEEEIKEYEDIRKEYQQKIADRMGKTQWMEYNEILFSANSCAIEGNSFTVDDTRILREQGMAMIPVGRSLLECTEMADHFHAFDYMVENLEHPFRDGNGRTGRLLSNFILLRADHPLLIVKLEDRSAYISALKKIRTEGTDEFLIAFFFQTAIKRMKEELAQKHKNGLPMMFF